MVAAVFVLQTTSGPGSAAPVLGQQQDTPAPTSPLDQISSSDVAVTVARMSDLPETPAVTNQADSESTELTTTGDNGVVAKPEVVATDSKSNKDIISYVTVAGDTVASLAQKFDVTSSSIQWSNNLKSSTLKPGTTLLIPPVEGIVYTVQLGDTPDTLAARFNASKDAIIAFNDGETGGIKVGERIVIPNGSVAAPVAKVVTTSSFGWGGGTATYGYNGYDFGYCTWWVAKLRADAGNPVPSNLGNASTWAVRAAGMGLPTGTTPRVGAAVVLSTRGAGHVAYVTAVNSDGSITVSEMNHEGWDRTDSRTITDATSYHYVY